MRHRDLPASLIDIDLSIYLQQMAHISVTTNSNAQFGVVILFLRLLGRLFVALDVSHSASCLPEENVADTERDCECPLPRTVSVHLVTRWDMSWREMTQLKACVGGGRPVLAHPIL